MDTYFYLVLERRSQYIFLYIEQSLAVLKYEKSIFQYTLTFSFKLITPLKKHL